MSNMPQGKYIVQLYNIAGQQLMNYSIQLAGSNFIQSLQLPSSISAGSYLIRLSDGAHQYTKTIIVAQ